MSSSIRISPNPIVDNPGSRDDSHHGVDLSPATQPAYFTRTKRYRCPVHHGKNLSVSVGYVDGRAWAKCWSRGCVQSEDILAALGITNLFLNPLDSATCITPTPTPTTNLKRPNLAACKPVCGL